ncbi:SHOCT domain-containing protein [Rhodococcus koreensis]
MGILKTAARVAVASSVHGRVQRRQQARWAEQDQTSPGSTPPPAGAAPAPAPPGAPVGPPPLDTEALLSQLERLGALRAAGVLTDEEFETQKARILAG